MIYLDSAATTLQKPKSVAAAAGRAVSYLGSPGRGGHSAAMRAADLLYSCREEAAKLFDVPDVENVVFTFNATHALNIAINDLVSPGDTVVVSGYEHNSVMRPLYAIGADVVTAASPLFDSEAAAAAFERNIHGAKCVICTQVSNVFGFILPVERIAKMCREAGVPFIIDASQSAGHLDISFRRLGADFIAMPGHKGLYGPQGTGILICRRLPKAYMHGGSGSDSKLHFMPDYLPDRLEAGTHNMVGIAGLYEGIKYVRGRTPEKIGAKEQALIRRAAHGLAKMPDMRVFSGGSQGGVLSFVCGSCESEALAGKLSEMQVAVRAGLHCAPAAHKTAGTLDSGTVRLSVSDFNTEGEIDEFLRRIKKLTVNSR